MNRSNSWVRFTLCLLAGICAGAPGLTRAEVGDPQLRTDHPWYPGELALSTFGRLFATQAGQYRRVTGRTPVTDEDKALASWFWRNTHYAHGEEGAQDWWGKGFGKGGDTRSREYWTGLFAHGFGLCGTTHSQWSAEMQHLLGHARARGAGMPGHNAFEVFLTGDAYGEGRWVLLDHDLSTVVFAEDGKRLLSLEEVAQGGPRLADRNFKPERQRGWLVSGLHPDDGKGYRDYHTAEYLPGYAGAPPMVCLRRGETLRRYFSPGLEDGKTFVFWGRNYNTGGIPGPERSRTWVNQPERMHGSREGTPHRDGQVRYANAVYTYAPDFRSGDYREGIVEEGDGQVVFEFRTPYLIAATPPDHSAWGIYQPGCRNGLIVRGKADAMVSVSVDRGRTWHEGGKLSGEPDLTDHVKGRQHYWLKLGAGAPALADAGLSITTVCQANVAVLPRLKDNGTTVSFAASHRAVVSAGPERPHAEAHMVAGAFDSPTVTLQLATPRGESVVAVHAAAHVASGNPPRPETKYHIDCSVDGGRTWSPVVQGWSIERRGYEPRDFWSQSFCYGSADLPAVGKGPVQVRFRNDGGKRYLRAEAQLIYETARGDSTKVTFAWRNAQGDQRATHTFRSTDGRPSDWTLATGQGVQTRWVEMEVVK
jgi:hypothetical protein